MTSGDTLLTIAEVGIAFAGFASIAVLFRRREHGRWRRVDALRFSSMVELSLVVSVLAILPLAVFSFGLSEQTTWVVSSSTLAIYYGFNAPRYLRGARQASQGGDLPLPEIAILLGLALFAVAQVSNALGLGFRRTAAPYIAFLLLALALAAISFARLVAIPEDAVEEDPE